MNSTYLMPKAFLPTNRHHPPFPLAIEYLLRFLKGTGIDCPRGHMLKEDSMFLLKKTTLPLKNEIPFSMFNDINNGRQQFIYPNKKG